MSGVVAAVTAAPVSASRGGGAPPPPAPPLSALYAAGWMFWLTRNTLFGSYCALTRASRS
jgi:hypothetical protein